MRIIQLAPLPLLLAKGTIRAMKLLQDLYKLNKANYVYHAKTGHESIIYNKKRCIPFSPPHLKKADKSSSFNNKPKFIKKFVK